MAASTLIRLEDISLFRGGETILDNIHLTLNKKRIITLIGPNGAGKSSLVKIALGLIHPDRGAVKAASNLRIGYVPQSIDLDAGLPVTVNRFLKLCGTQDKEEIRQKLSLVGGERLERKPLHMISGGELKRVLLARALLKSPNLLILDEPASGVDISGQASLYTLIRNIRDEYHCGVLLVSHNLHIVMAATDTVVCLNRHICCSGTPEDVQQHPQFVSLFGRQNADALGVYRHHHDHEHNLHGEICDHG